MPLRSPRLVTAALCAALSGGCVYDLSRPQPDQGIAPDLRLDAPVDGPPDAPRLEGLPQAERTRFDARPADKPLADRPLDSSALDGTQVVDQPALLVRWRSSVPIIGPATGYCAGPVVGGGGQCDSVTAIPWMKALLPSLNSYHATCGQGTSTVYYACPELLGQVMAPARAKICTGSVVGGGCDCGNGQLLASHPTSVQDWNCLCQNGSSLDSPVPKLVCIPPLAAVLTFGSGGKCSPGEQLVAGGCSCGAGHPIIRSAPNALPLATAWDCDCGGIQGVAYAICGAVK